MASGRGARDHAEVGLLGEQCSSEVMPAVLMRKKAGWHCCADSFFAEGAGEDVKSSSWLAVTDDRLALVLLKVEDAELLHAESVRDEVGLVRAGLAAC